MASLLLECCYTGDPHGGFAQFDEFLFICSLFLAVIDVVALIIQIYVVVSSLVPQKQLDAVKCVCKL